MAIMPKPESTAVSTGAATTKRISGVSAAGAQRLMEMSINLYADPNEATVREVVANGVDATIFAGTAAAVNVTLPTRLNPVLVVTDHGSGMTSDELDDHFLMFADSTKINTNDQVGCLGVGAKSPLSISESFLVDSVKHGKRNMVRVSRTLEHDDLIRDMDTDAPNGTTISIPVDVNAADWESIVRRVATAHPQGHVTVNGESVESIQNRTWIGPVAFYDPEHRSYGSAPLTVVSGGTLFDFPSSLQQYLENITGVLHGATVRLDVGSFDFSPTREAIMDTARTRNTLHAAAQRFIAARDALQKELDDLIEQGMFTEAVERRREVLNGYTSIDVLQFPHTVKFPESSTLRRVRDRSAARASSWARNATHLNIGGVLSGNARILIVTDIPKGRGLRSIGRFLDAEYPDVNTVVVAGDGGEVSLAVYKSARATGDPVGALVLDDATEGVHRVTYAAMTARVKELIAESRTTTVSAKGDRLYEVVRHIAGENKYGYSRDMTLTQLEEMVEDMEGETRIVIQRRKHTNIRAEQANSLGENIVVVIHGSYTPKPLIEAFPDHTTEEAVKAAADEAARNRITDELVIQAAVHSYDNCQVFSIARELASYIPADSAARGILKELEVYWDIAAAVPSEEVNTAHNDYVMRDAMREHALWGEVTALAKRFTAAYPMLEVAFSYSYRGRVPLEHIAAYVASTPPVEVMDSDGDA